MNNRGLTFLETLVAMVLGIFVILGGARVIKQAMKTQQKSASKRTSEVDLGLVHGHIIQIGRLANTCKKIAASELECQVDFNIPPTGSLTKVRFILVGQNLLYERYVPGAWKEYLHYPNITTFEICDDEDMTQKRCLIEPTVINSQHAANLTALSPTPPGKFFRFRLVAEVWITEGKVQEFSPSIYGAFFTRNPAPLGLVYQWGGTEEK